MRKGLIAIIPAKGFSDALKQKNLQDWGGGSIVLGIRKVRQG